MVSHRGRPLHGLYFHRGPGTRFGAGAVAFFAAPDTIVIYPVLFLVFPRLWHVCHKHGLHHSRRFCAKAASAIAGLPLRSPSPALSQPCPISRFSSWAFRLWSAHLEFPERDWRSDLPLIIAFVILAAFTYSSGLRAPASIAIVKDILIYITAFAVIIAVPIQLGGFAKIFAAIPDLKTIACDARAKHHRRLQPICHARSRFSARSLSLSTFADGHLERKRGLRDLPERCVAAWLPIFARVAGADWFFCHCRGVGQTSGIRRRL